MQNEKAFSLAEMLVVIAIMGRLILVTVPSRVNNVKKQARLTYIQKAYEALDKVYNYAIYDDNSIAGVCDPGAPAGLCTASTNQYNNFNDVVEKMFYNNMRATGFDATTTPGVISFSTRDGMTYSFSKFKPSCGYLSNNDKTANLKTKSAAEGSSCFIIDIDVNGSAGPNKPTDASALKNGEWNDQYRLYAFKDSIEFLTSENILIVGKKAATEEKSGSAVEESATLPNE